MLGRASLAALILLASVVSSQAQDVQNPQPSGESAVIQRWPTREAQPTPSAPADTAAQAPAPTARVAQPRPAAPPPVAASAAPAPAAAAAAEQQRRPSGRDRDGGQPRVAVPREPRQAPRPGGTDAGRRPDPSPRGGRPTIYVARPPISRYYYPRNVYPYGYGAFGGLGYFYYDPYSWYSRAPLYAYGPGAYGAGYFGRGYGYDIGEIRFRVTPRDAQVFVDGYYAGEVDDYDGILQSLRLESGAYHIELVAPGYAPLEVDIRVNPGQKVTYRGDLRRQP